MWRNSCAPSRRTGGRNAPLFVRCVVSGAMPQSGCRLPEEAKHRVSSLASGSSLGYLVRYESMELLYQDRCATIVKNIFPQAPKPG